LFVSADVIDRNPTLLLKMRGIGQHELLSALLAPRGDGEYAPADCDGIDEDTDGAAFLRENRHDGELDVTGSAFYGSDTLLSDLSGFKNADSGRLCKPEPCPSMFNFPFWKGENTFQGSIEPYYGSVREMLNGRN
jgi:hypothetical protein